MPRAVCIIVPVLGRPDNVARTIQTVGHATPPGSYRLLFVATETDDEEIRALKDHNADYITVDEPGTYARKINAGARASHEPLLFMAADDLAYHDGWLEAAASLVGQDNGKATIEVVGTNDLGNPRTIHGEHSTHTLVTRRYIDTQGGVIDQPPGAVLCELYPHEWADDEFVQTAQSRFVYAHAYNAHVEHLHYLWGKGEDDATYELGRKYSRASRSWFVRRQQLWRPRQRHQR